MYSITAPSNKLSLLQIKHCPAVKNLSAVTAIFLDPAERYRRVYIFRNSFITLLSMTQLSTIKIIIIRDLNCDNLFKNGNRILGISAKYMTACMQTTDDSNICQNQKRFFSSFYYSVKCPSIKCQESSFDLVCECCHN